MISSFCACVRSSIDVACTNLDASRTELLQCDIAVLNSGWNMWSVRVRNTSSQFSCNKTSRGARTTGELVCERRVSKNLMIGVVSGVIRRDASSLRCG